jgi:hypothetical protein
MKSVLVSVRISKELRERIAKAMDKARDPYAPNLSQIVTRGIELALREIAKKAGKK